jgi:heat-inducible transcriptional repressor
MLDRRSQILLKTLVERYITEGEPVGSRALSRYSGLDLSPATVRNIMADLEELGFIASPHTSAGRVPTPRGYRFFVDTLLKVKPLDRGEISQLEGNLHPEHPQNLISSASQLLSELTHFAGVVYSPALSAAFRHIEFLALSEKRVLLILVTPHGDVQNRILFTEKTFTPSELTTVANFLNQNYAGLTFDDIRRQVQDELKQLRGDMMVLMTAALDAGDKALSESAESYVISGEKNLLDSRTCPPTCPGCANCSICSSGKRCSCRFSM